MSLNKVMLIGRLGRDPEVKYTQSGTPVTTFSLATDERWNDKSGEKQERTEWHNVVCWSKLAELAGKYLAKGREVYVEGRLQTRKWEDNQGNERRAVEIIATNLTFIGKADGNGGGRADDHGSRGGTAVTPENPISDDDLPF